MTAFPAARFFRPRPRPRLIHLALSTALSSMLALVATAQSADPAGAAGAQSTVPALAEILIIAERDKAASQAGTTTVIGAEELGQRNAADMAAVARYLPLVSVPLAASGQGSVWDSSGNTGFNIRGLEGNRVSLDIDGIAMPDAAPKPDGNSTNSFGIGRDYFDPETFREVQISSGTTTAGAGTPGLGGSVAFATKAPEDYLVAARQHYAAYKLGYDSANNSRSQVLTGALRSGPVNVLAMAIHRDGAQIENHGAVAANPQDWSSDALLARANWAVNPSNKLGLTLDVYRRDNDSMLGNLSALYPNGAQKQASTRRNRLSLDHRYVPVASMLADTLTSRVYVQDARSVDVTDALYTFGGRNQRHITTGLYTKSYGLATDAAKKITGADHVSYGIAYENAEIRRPWLEDRLVLATGLHQLTRKNRMADTDSDKFSAYLRDEICFDLAGYKAQLSPGLRGEYRKLSPNNLHSYLIAVPAAASEIRTDRQSAWTPGVSLAVNLTAEILAYIDYQRGARLPSAAERTGSYDSFSYTGAGTGYAVMGNPALKTETSDAFELGVKGAAVRGITSSWSVFHTAYRDFIDYAAQPLDPLTYPTVTQGLFRPENIGKAAIWGAELAGRAELGTWAQALRGASVEFGAGITHSRAENTRTGKRGALASTLPFKGSIGAAYDDPAGRFGAALHAVYTDAKQAQTEVTSTSTLTYFAVPSATVLDMNTYWNISKRMHLNATVYNLADRQYWDYASTRSLASGSSAATLAEIERQARPGRNYGLNLSVNF